MFGFHVFGNDDSEDILLTPAQAGAGVGAILAEDALTSGGVSVSADHVGGLIVVEIYPAGYTAEQFATFAAALVAEFTNEGGDDDDE